MKRAGLLAVALVLVASAAWAQPHVFYAPGSIVVQPGQQFDLSFQVGACADSIASFQLYMSFDPDVVELVAATEGSLYAESGYMTWFIAEEQEDGFWHFFDTVFGPRTYVLPPGELLHLRFEAVEYGHTQAYVDTIRMTDIRRNALPVAGFEHGEIYVVPTGVEDEVPGALMLGPAWPSPFRGSTEIPFSAPPGRGPVTAAVYDICGRVVAELAPESERSGTLVWDGRTIDGSEAPSAVYFVRVTAGDSEARTRVVKIR
jgi:hypothetical protein